MNLEWNKTCNYNGKFTFMAADKRGVYPWSKNWQNIWTDGGSFEVPRRTHCSRGYGSRREQEVT